MFFFRFSFSPNNADKTLLNFTFRICGPFAVLMSYLSEFHGTNHRPRVMMYIGMFFSLSTILLSLSAWFILSKNWTIVFKEYFGKKKLH